MDGKEQNSSKDGQLESPCAIPRGRSSFVVDRSRPSHGGRDSNGAGSPCVFNGVARAAQQRLPSHDREGVVYTGFRRLTLLTLLVFCSQAEVIDRLAITVGPRVITEQQLDEEIRVTAFLNREEISRVLNSRRAAADRLVEQLLVKREMELSHYPLPDAEDVEKYLAEIRRSLGPPSSFTQSLAAYDVTEPTLREHLALQLTAMRFVEYRFRPDIGISDADIQALYERKLTAWKADHTGPPATLDSSRESIRKALLEQRIDETLNTWLEETRKLVSIVYLDKSLQ